MGSGQSSFASIHEGEEEGSLSITSNIRKLIEGKTCISEKGKVSSTPQANSQSQDLDDFSDALDGEDMNQNFIEINRNNKKTKRSGRSTTS